MRFGHITIEEGCWCHVAYTFRNNTDRPRSQVVFRGNQSGVGNRSDITPCAVRPRNTVCAVHCRTDISCAAAACSVRCGCADNGIDHLSLFVGNEFHDILDTAVEDGTERIDRMYGDALVALQFCDQRRTKPVFSNEP